MIVRLPKISVKTRIKCDDLKIDLFTSLSIEERSQLCSLIRTRMYNDGEMIFSQGDIISGLWMLCYGKAQLIHLNKSGYKQVVKLLKDGDCFGEEGFIQASASTVSAQALADSLVGWLSSEDFRGLMKHFPALALALQKRLTDEIGALRVRLAELAYLGTREKLVKLLMELGEKYGYKSERGLVIDLALTEQKLADMVGNTRVWVCRQLGVLQERGLIAYRRGELVILNEGKLREFAPPPAKHRAIFSFWSGVAEMCKVIYTMSVNYFIDKGGDSNYTVNLEVSANVAETGEVGYNSVQSEVCFESVRSWYGGNRGGDPHRVYAS